jgi:hypothetical protein
MPKSMQSEPSRTRCGHGFAKTSHTSGTKAYSCYAKTEYAKTNTGTRRCDRVCQTRERVGDEGKHRCCQYRACEERDQ